MEEKTDSNNR
jgi:hypothetical protein